MSTQNDPTQTEMTEALKLLEAGDFWAALDKIREAVGRMSDTSPKKGPMAGALWAIQWIGNVEGVQSRSALNRPPAVMSAGGRY